MSRARDSGQPPPSAEGLVPGAATRIGTQKFAKRFGGAAGHFRSPDTLTLSSIALGTRKGGGGESEDLLYRFAVSECLAGGVNVFNTAVSDRAQYSERALGAALAQALREKVVTRDEVVVISKAGELTPEPESMRDHSGYNRRQNLIATYIDSGIVNPAEIAHGHCMSPAFLSDQVERSRRNLGLESIDIYMIQEPERHLKELGPAGFRRALAHAFEALEEQVATGHIGSYGVCSWNGLLLPDNDRSHLSLTEVFEVALEVGSAEHHMRALQFPYGLATGEAEALSNQLGPDGRARTLLSSLSGTGTAVFVSAPLHGGMLAGRVPGWIREAFPDAHSDAQCALQFVRSTQNVTSVVVGMRTPAHIEENLALASIAPADPSTPDALIHRAGSSQDGA